MFAGASVLAVDVSELLLGAGMVAAGFRAIIHGLKELNRAWRVYTTDSVPINEAIATDELVQITGSVQPSQSSNVIVSPIRSEECVAYEYQIRSQLSDNSTNIDSGIEYRPFRISDGTAEIIVDPTQQSLSFETQKKTVTGAHRVSEEIDLENVDMDPSAEINDSGSVPNPIELIEGTISTGEEIAVVGKANPASNGATEETSIDANGVMTPTTGHLNIIDNLTRTTAVKIGAQGVLLSIVGSVFSLGGLIFLVRNLDYLL
ncbi:hypothetical protein [Haloquadratum walsbyi]|uniref:Uncharacterized protein n=1 Tax=Haloquadratum walsbyi J07HQW2 TaxID=1238425 RepID=U1NAR1_9EURY|nr:hypothetical protein [Haloquadratum walsbyi]ERG93905.1 MAG: hypothetical protein J07HQW2_00339 [Haloquadratum walsbyi J07HQW2]